PGKYIKTATDRIGLLLDVLLEFPPDPILPALVERFALRRAVGPVIGVTVSELCLLGGQTPRAVLPSHDVAAIDSLGRRIEIGVRYLQPRSFQRNARIQPPVFTAVLFGWLGFGTRFIAVVHI